jgi:hypothetical protein
LTLAHARVGKGQKRVLDGTRHLTACCDDSLYRLYNRWVRCGENL